jgi:hypothetical protein
MIFEVNILTKNNDVKTNVFETLLRLLSPKQKIRRHQNFISKKTSFLTITLFWKHANGKQKLPP